MCEELGSTNEASFYRDVTETGGLETAIQAQLNAIGSPLFFKEKDPNASGFVPFNWESLRHKRRSSQIKTAIHERLFMLDFWDQGVCLAHGSAPSLQKVAEVLNTWLVGEVATGKLHEMFSFVTLDPRAEAHDKGAAAEVEWKWQSLYKFCPKSANASGPRRCEFIYGD